MCFLPNTQMSVQSKSAPRQLTHLTRQRNHEQQSYTHSKGYTLLETSAFKTTSLVILKLGESFKPWPWYFIKLNIEVMMVVPRTTLLHEHTHAHTRKHIHFLKWNRRAEEQALT